MAMITKQLLRPSEFMAPLLNDIPQSLNVHDMAIWLGGWKDHLSDWTFVNGYTVPAELQQQLNYNTRMYIQNLIYYSFFFIYVK